MARLQGALAALATMGAVGQAVKAAASTVKTPGLNQGVTAQRDSKTQQQTVKKTAGSGYKPVDSSGNDYAGLVGMSGNDRAALAAQKAAWNKAAEAGDQAGMDAAHKAAEAIRAGYGYSGGVDGSQYLPSQTQTPGLTYADLQKSYLEQERRMEDTYAKLQAQQEAAKRAAVEQAVNGLSGQKDQLEQGYGDLYRQLYIDRKMAEKRLPQQMAAMGYTGGLTESAALGLQHDYREALQQGEQERLGTAADIDRAINDARLQGDISIAEQAAQTAKDKLDSYTSLLESMRQQANTDRQFGLQEEQLEYGKSQDQLAQENWLRSMNRQELLDQLEREDLAYERKLAAAQYLYQTTGDASGLQVMGYTNEQLAALERQWAAQQQAQAAAKRTGTVASVPKTGVLGTMLSMDNDAKAYEYLVLNGGLNATETANLWQLYQEERERAEEEAAGADMEETRTKTAAYGPYYKSILRTAQGMRAQGSSDAEIKDYLNRFGLEQLNAAGRERILLALNLGGYGDMEGEG